MMNTIDKQKNINTVKGAMLSNKRKRLIFYSLMVSLPLLQLAIFYFYVNIRSFTLAFTKPDFETNRYVWAGLENFKAIISDFEREQYGLMIKNSIMLSGLNTVFGLGLAVLFSYYIYKKNIFSGTFKVILYLPQIVSGLVFMYIFQYFVDIAIPELWVKLFNKEILGPMANPKTKLGTIIFFNIWFSFGINVLLFSSAMSSISDSVIESASLDGAKPMRELVSIVLPSIYPTFVTFLLLRIVSVFTDQMSLFTLFDIHAERKLYTLGYYLYRNVVASGESSYPYLSAMGMLMTLVAVPLTLVTRYLLTKFGPKTV